MRGVAVRQSRTCVAFVVLVLVGAAVADETGQAASVGPKLTPPTITFTFDFPRGRPAYFSITLDATGQAVYESRDHGFPEEPAELDEPYRKSFLVSAPTRDRIFALAHSVNLFRGDFDYTRRKIANMGRKTLVWWDGTERIATSYNWSENGYIDDLTTIFMGIGSTQEFGRRLEFLRRYDRLGLDAELRSMEEQVKGRPAGLPELQSIAGLLRSIAKDPAVMKIARQRAERLLASMPGGAAAGPAPH
ncbi:MAG TPA: hypothetical protein VNK82_04235 [Terriglobales bacterium]|nr:hypothetical protein [Terriglobales bacterium]